MYSDRRVPFLRWTSLLALATSAILTADRLHPGRAFCPLEAACEKARDSALGSVAGIPTSAIGMLAFGGLFLLTLLPISTSRRALRPAGILAGVTGAGLILYQAFVIGSFCPLCLVADGAGLACAVTVLGWRPPPVRLSGRPLPREPLVTHLRWIGLATIVVTLPFAWPRAETPSWVALDDANPLLADLAPLPAPPTPTEDAAAAGPAPGEPALPATEPTPTPLPPIPRLARDASGRVVLPAPAAATWTPMLAPGKPTPPAGARPEEVPPWATLASASARSDGVPATAIATAPQAAPAGVAAPAAAPAATPPPSRTPPIATAPPPPTPPTSSAGPVPTAIVDTRPQVGIVEYVNAFCPHCRVTHRRLGRVLASLGVAARVRRIYTWPSEEVPAWARACAHAQTLGLEDRLFDELSHAENDDLAEILAAGRRAGLDVGALRAAIASGALAPRLERDRRIAGSAGLQGLPTLDIGRRRLLGEQSEAELREAIEAALALRRDAR